MTKKRPIKKNKYIKKLAEEFFEDLDISRIEENSELMDISTYGDVSFFSSTKKTKIPTGDVSSSPHKKIKTPLCDSFQSPGATNAAQNYGGVDVFGSSFLMTRTGTKQSIQDQLDNGEDPNYQNNRGDSALHIVARELDANNFYNCIERISLLIKHGAKISMPNNKKITSLDIILNKLKRGEIKLDKVDSNIFYQNILGAILSKETLDQYKDNYIRLLNDFTKLVPEGFFKQHQDDINNFLEHNPSIMDHYSSEELSIISSAINQYHEDGSSITSSISSVNKEKLTPLSSFIKGLPSKTVEAGIRIIQNEIIHNALDYAVNARVINIINVFDIEELSRNILEFLGYSEQLFSSIFPSYNAAPSNLRINSMPTFEMLNPLWYSDQQITNLLTYYLGNTNVNILAAVQMEHQHASNSVIREAINIVDDRQVAVVPLHIHGNHWISMLFSNDNNRLQVTIQDSLGGSIQQIPRIIEEIRRISPNANIVDVSLHQQRNGDDCGAWTVDNLVRLARAASREDLPNTAEGVADMLDIDINPHHIRRDHHSIDRTVRLSETDELEGYTSRESSENGGYAHFFDSMVLQNTDSDNEGSIPTTSSSNEYMQENVTAQHTIPSFPQTGNVNVAGVSINFVTADFLGPLFY